MACTGSGVTSPSLPTSPPTILDRYDYKLENYVLSKFRITQNQTGGRRLYLLPGRSHHHGIPGQGEHPGKKIPFHDPYAVGEGAYPKTIN
jgi:UDP-N-acetylmuramoylalanine--D-glutamate ligase